MKNEKILVTASTGNVGQYVAKALQKKQIPFTAATRDSNKAKDMLGSQTETVFVDFRDESSFGPALKGKEKLFLCGPAATPDADDLLLPLAKEAKA